MEVPLTLFAKLARVHFIRNGLDDAVFSSGAPRCDGADYGIIDNTVQLQGAPFPGVMFSAALPSASAGLSDAGTVPEPTASGFAILSAAALLARRRRRRPR